MRCLDLFSGIGGFALAARWMGWETVGFCEIELFCQRVLRKHWPDVWLHDDIKLLTSNAIRRNCGTVDLICGGFPCQDLSAAGKGAGIHGSRSGLWWDMQRVIAEIQPRWVVVENVPALRTRGSDAVLASLEDAGYSVWPLVVGAWAVSAPHRRDRVWIVGHTETERYATGHAGVKAARVSSSELGNAGLGNTESERGEGWCLPVRQGRSQQTAIDANGTSSGVAVAECSRLERLRSEPGQPQITEPWIYRAPARPGQQQYEWEEPRTTQPTMGASTNGLPVNMAGWRRESLKAVGNSIVPQVAYEIFKAIEEVQ